MKALLGANESDLSVLAELHALAFAEPWTARAIGELLASSGTFAFRANDGFVLARVAGSEAEILTLAVRPERRRLGTGSVLICAAADEALARGAAELFLEVGRDNAAARALYGRLGFVMVGERKNYYATGTGSHEDALILRSKLPLSPLGKSPRAG